MNVFTMISNIDMLVCHTHMYKHTHTHKQKLRHVAMSIFIQYIVYAKVWHFVVHDYWMPE